MNPTIDPVRLDKVSAVVLGTGTHKNIAAGACVLEAVSYVAGERWSDHPQCACPVIASFLRSWNDRLPDDERQELKQYIPLLVGSRSTHEVERKRSWMLTDWAVRECAPIWLRKAGMESQAAIMESLSPLTGQDEYAKVRPAIEAIRSECWKKRDGWRDRFVAAFKAKLAEKGKPADAYAAAYAAADADADAAADAAAYAAAYAAAAAAAYAAADADAAAAADADAYAAAYAAAAAAAAAAAYANYWKIRDAVYNAVKDVFRKKLKETSDQSRASAHALVRRLLAVT